MRLAIFLNLILALIYAPPASSQKSSEDFRISPPETRVVNSLYNQITLLDNRPDTSQMGIVQVGALNRKIFVIPEIPLQVQFDELLRQLTHDTALNGKLLLQLRQFSFAEVTGFTTEKGFCYLRAELYAEKDQYQKIASLDTLVYLRNFDVTRGIQRQASKVITAFIADNLTKEPASQEKLSLDQILNIDAIEKSETPLYTNDTLANGLYASFDEFRRQQPQPNIWVFFKKGLPREVYTVSEKGKKKIVQPRDIYAVVYEGKTYVSTDFGFYELKKKGNDFVFRGRVKTNADGTAVFAASFFFGIMGGLMASDASEVIDMKIDHRNGGFIPLEQGTKPMR